MKASETKNRFETSLKQLKTGLAKNGINIPIFDTMMTAIFRPVFHV